MTALAGLNLEVREGDFITVIGSNGAGKSTLLRVIGGLIETDSGSVELDGREITREPVWRRAASIGRIAQDPQESTCAVMTIAENLAMAAKRGQRRGLRRAMTPALAERFRAALAQGGLGLEGRLDVRIGTLSGGQRQAVALLMATLARPRGSRDADDREAHRILAPRHHHGNAQHARGDPLGEPARHDA